MFLNELKEKMPVKMLLIGDTGSGKTGALASLAKAGYKLHILDFDNGVPVIASYLNEAELKTVEVEVLTDKMKVLPNGQVIPEDCQRPSRKE